MTRYHGDTFSLCVYNTSVQPTVAKDARKTPPGPSRSAISVRYSSLSMDPLKISHNVKYSMDA